jgi:hypothetical protein
MSSTASTISRIRSTPIVQTLVRRFSRLHNRRASILSYIPKHSVCAEIGVYKGDFSELILECRPKQLHLIDPWKFEPGPTYAGSWYGGEIGKNQTRMDTIYESVQSRFRSAIGKGTVQVHRSASTACCSEFLDGYFDWIYIDGNHRYEFVKLDLELFRPKVKPRGFIAGDDYATPGWWQDGVTRAVDEAIDSGQFENVLIENHQFLLRKI